MDVARLRQSFDRIAVYGDELPLFFYSDLFIKHPEVRELFPVSMAVQRAHLADALVKIVSQVENVTELTAFLQGLGRDHRKFGALAGHYAAVGDSLLTTIEHFSGPAWTAELAADWQAAYELIASVMTAAAREDEEQRRPAWWRGVVVDCERRAFDISVLLVRPEPRLDYLPGQSVTIEAATRPRLWRYYSMASPPREDGLLEFHVRLIDGGAVSMALTSSTVVGTQLRLGPPAGALILDRDSDRDILLVAGSTGLAPLKAILGQLAAWPWPPRVHLFFGARTAEGLYDQDSLEKMAAQRSWLTVVPAVSDDPRFAGETGRLADVVTRHGDWSGRDAYLAGPTEMVEETTARLVRAGMARDQIHTEDFGWSEP